MITIKSNIIGHTRSGKHIYENHRHSSHKDFTSSDHRDAMNTHMFFQHKHLNEKEKELEKKHGEDWYSHKGAKKEYKYVAYKYQQGFMHHAKYLSGNNETEENESRSHAFNQVTTDGRAG